MTLTTAVILARGLGSRMRAGDAAGLNPAQAAAAASGHKAMMPTAGRPFLDFALSGLADAGIEHVVLVVAPDHAAMAEHVASLPLKRLRVSLAVQEEPRGTADAVAAAEQAVAGERFVMLNGDNLYPREAIEGLSELDGHSTIGFDRAALVEQSNIPADRVGAFALIEHRDGKLVEILEKPSPAVVAAAGPHALVSMNCFAFGPEVFDACRAVLPSARGELEIVDAVRMLARSHGVRVLPLQAGVLDLSSRADIASVEAILAGRSVEL